MNETDIKEIQSNLENWFVEKKFSKLHVLAFLTASLINTMASYGFDQDSFDSTMDLMKKIFKSRN